MQLPNVLFVLSIIAAVVPAQAAGVRGAGQEPRQIERLTPPDAAMSERVITVEATAEVRVAPSELRVVFAISATGESGSNAHQKCRALLADTRTKLLAVGVTEAELDADFIAALPIFGWQIQKQSGREVLAESRLGTRVQYNLHVTVANEASARAVIEAATATDGIEVLAVDYWSDALAKLQVQAQQKALTAAQDKARLLLSVFPVPPRPINVHEQTRVLYPQQLYQNLPAAEDSANSWYARDLPRVPATRPLQIYYRGLFADVDAVEPTMPGRREIEIVATVRLYFEAPERPSVR